MASGVGKRRRTRSSRFSLSLSSLRGLGNRPLAEALFTDPLVSRRPLEFVRVDFRHPLWKRARQVFGKPFPALWARRSLFMKRGRPLMVTEVFLPALLELRR